jgi:hypothetical protein
MGNADNLTYLFQGSLGRADTLPHFSESFWTAVLSLFLFHLGAQEGDADLPPENYTIGEDVELCCHGPNGGSL